MTWTTAQADSSKPPTCSSCEAVSTCRQPTTINININSMDNGRTLAKLHPDFQYSAPCTTENSEKKKDGFQFFSHDNFPILQKSQARWKNQVKRNSSCPLFLSTIPCTAHTCLLSDVFITISLFSEKCVTKITSKKSSHPCSTLFTLDHFYSIFHNGHYG